MTAPAFALLAGIVYTALGLLGMLSSLVLPASGAPASFGYLVGIFPVNGPVNAIHLFLGAWGIAAWSGVLGSVRYARVLAVAMAAMAILGLMPGSLGSLPLHSHNIWLHGLTAAAAAYIGFRSIARYETLRKKVRERRRHSANRRLAARPVVVERRARAYDRRYHGTLSTG